jgi:hypothetical protein
VGVLLVEDGQRPAPAGNFAGDGRVGHYCAFLAFIETNPASIQTPVGCLAPCSGGWRRCLPTLSIGAYLGLVPTEYSSGSTRTQGGVTKTDNGHARRLLVEAAWHHRPRYRPRARAAAQCGNPAQASQPTHQGGTPNRQPSRQWPYRGDYGGPRTRPWHRTPHRRQAAAPGVVKVCDRSHSSCLPQNQRFHDQVSTIRGQPHSLFEIPSPSTTARGRPHFRHQHAT